METRVVQESLMQALVMKRKNIEKVGERVRDGWCILDVDVRDRAGKPTGEKKPCTGECTSRGLCEYHRQLWYRDRRKLRNRAARLEFEERCIQQGLILPPREQEEWTRENPFTPVAG